MELDAECPQGDCSGYSTSPDEIHNVVRTSRGCPLHFLRPLPRLSQRPPKPRASYAGINTAYYNPWIRYFT